MLGINFNVDLSSANENDRVVSIKKHSAMQSSMVRWGGAMNTRRGFFMRRLLVVDAQDRCECKVYTGVQQRGSCLRVILVDDFRRH